MNYPRSPEKSWNPFSADIWIAWLGATAIGVAGITTFFYMNFETKESFANYRSERERFEDDVQRRLERIEDKLDQALRR
jgi:hypothetical protein